MRSRASRSAQKCRSSRRWASAHTVGFEVFDEEHADLFFGRDGDDPAPAREAQEHAVPRRRSARRVVASRRSYVPGDPEAAARSGLPGSETWTVGVLTPGAHPLETLAARLAQDVGWRDDAADARRAARRPAHAPPRSHPRPRRPTARGAGAAGVVDQFEEVFTLCRDADERAAFVANLLYAASIPDGRCTVVLTMRADFYHRCARLSGACTATRRPAVRSSAR